jgi:hypothetical protein
VAKAAKTVAVPAKRRGFWESEDVKQDDLAEIIRRIAEGESLIKVCQSLNTDGSKRFPSPATFLAHIKNDPYLSKQYARAIEMRSDIFVESMMDISDDDPNPARARNRIETRKYHNEKLAPKKYGAKFLAENTVDVNIKQKVDLTLIPSQVRNQLREALLRQIELKTIEND